jgi:signal transduction histidine kinase
MVSLWNGSTEMVNDATVQTLDGEKRFVIIHILICQGYESTLGKVLVSLIDITKRKIAEEALIDKQQRLSDMALELSMAEERERRRIATNLHDTIGQDLALTRINLGVLAKASLMAKESKILDNTREILNRAIKKVRNLTHLISPPILESAGLEAALKWLGIQMETDYALRVQFTDDLREKTVAREIQTELYFAARELLINITKHAKTENARISVSRENNTVIIRISDDGIGFACDAMESNLIKENCFGIFNIRRRIIYLGGSFDIISAPGSGTSVTIGMPLKRDES